MTSQRVDHRRCSGGVVLLAAAAALAGCGGSGSGGAIAAQALKIAAPTSPLTTGSTAQLTVTETDANGMQTDVTARAAWQTSNSAVADIATDGQVLAESAGSATITARIGGLVASALLTVTGASGTVAPGYAYIASTDVQGRAVPGAIYQYTIASDGSWTAMSTPSVATGVRPVAMVADPSERFLYVVNTGDATISQYAVGAGGVLMPLSPPTVAVSSAFFESSVSVDPTGRYLYVSIHLPDPAPAATIAEYSIGANGALTPLVPATIDVPAFADGALVIDPLGRFAYATVQAAPMSGILELSVAADGTLAALSPNSIAATPGPVTLTITPDGQRSYVLGACIDAACNGAVTGFAIGADGQLTAQGARTLTGAHVNPVALVIDGTGPSAFVLVNQMGVDTNVGAVEQYQIAADGMLVPNSAGPVATSPGAVAEGLYGANLYVLSANALGVVSGSLPGGHIGRCTVDATGTVTRAGTIAVAASLPVALVLLPAR